MSVSPRHASVHAFESGIVKLSAEKVAWMRRKGSGAGDIYPTDSEVVTLNVGDAFFLSKREDVPVFGFQLEKDSRPKHKPKRALDSPTSQARAKRQQGQPPAEQPEQFLKGLEVVFWEQARQQCAMQRAREAGAVVPEPPTISPRTTHVVASRDMSRAALAARLGQNVDGLRLPENVCFVNKDYIPKCIGHGKLVPPADYLLPACHAPDPEEAAAHATPSQPDKAEVAVSDAGPSAKGRLSAKGSSPPDKSSAAASSAEANAEGVLPGCGDSSRVTGGDSGRPWGHGGCWLEPWDRAAAEDTLEKLYKHWHGWVSRRRSSASKASGGVPGEGRDKEMSEEDQWEEAVGKAANRGCHKACAACSTCIVGQFRLLQKLYAISGAPEDKYRAQKTTEASWKVEQHDRELRTDEDIEGLNLGKKSTEKVKEILATGQLERVRLFFDDPKMRVLDLFTDVWGAGKSVAERWYDDGCRSLDDVRQRQDLTAQQRAGLQHFDDLKLPISRKECQAIAAVVAEAVERLFSWPAGGLEPAHVRCMGSFIRGKPATSDVDMLILPPGTDRRPSQELLEILLADLRAQGFVTEDLKTKKTTSRGEKSCTFLGFCRLAGCPHFRRLDIKIYPRESLPFAVNYFTGSGPFNRALRYWATTAKPAVAAAEKLVPGSRGFKLSDTDLTAITRTEVSKQERQTGLAAWSPPNIRCETDIFKILGLSYVPPHMRFFNNYH